MAQDTYSVWCVGPSRHRMDYGFDREIAISAWNTRANADLDAALSANRELVRQLAEVRKAGDALADAVRTLGYRVDHNGVVTLLEMDGMIKVKSAMTKYRNATTAKETT